MVYLPSTPVTRTFHAAVGAEKVHAAVSIVVDCAGNQAPQRRQAVGKVAGQFDGLEVQASTHARMLSQETMKPQHTAVVTHAVGGARTHPGHR